MSRLGVITCHFNPCGFKRPVENWWRWREHLPADLPVTSVELSFDGSFNTDSQIQLRGKIDRNCLWQKECLLNVALQSLPPEIDRVAWIDADFIFPDGWVEAANERLDDFPLVHLYSRVRMLNADGSVAETPASVIAEPNARRAKPGGAWAARRDTLAAGFYDRLVIGAGDVALLHAAQGLFDGFFMKRQNVAMRRDWLAWAPPWYSAIRNRIGHLDIEAAHLFHGTREKRQYGTREAALLTHGYDPARHVRYNSDGVLEWTDAAPPDMRGRLRSYFQNRMEDE